MPNSSDDFDNKAESKSTDKSNDESPEPSVDLDLFTVMPDTFPAYFPRAGYCLSYEFASDNTIIHVHRFASCSLPIAGLENIQFEALHLLFKVRVSTGQTVQVIDSKYPLEGSLLTYYFEVVAEALEKILVLAGADNDTCADVIAQLSICNNNYIITLN